MPTSIQILLGYSASKTTGVYTHVANTSMNSIKNLVPSVNC